MDFLSVLGAITGLIGIPSSIYAFIQIRREIESSASKREKTPDDVRTAITATGQRVLIEFEMRNADKVGTLENAVMRFVNAYPDSQETRWLL
jgi:hypothetical protein